MDAITTVIQERKLATNPKDAELKKLKSLFFDEADFNIKVCKAGNLYL